MRVRAFELPAFPGLVIRSVLSAPLMIATLGFAASHAQAQMTPPAKAKAGAPVFQRRPGQSR
jgi:hypothetical protein